MSKKPHGGPVTLTGKVYTINALSDVYGPELKPGQGSAGDLKLWCVRSRARGAVFGQGELRAALHDGSDWRTFKLLNVVKDSAYGSIQDRDAKAGCVIRALKRLQGQRAFYRNSSYGVTDTMKGESAPPRTVEKTTPTPTPDRKSVV